MIVARLIRDGVALHYDLLGDGDPALVLVHGLACNRHFWPAQVEHFASSHRILVPDLRGHGASDSPEQAYTVPVFAEDVRWMCDELGIDRPVLVGHSLGGLVALEAAAAMPDRAAGVVLIDSVMMPPGDREGFLDTLVAELRTGDAEHALRAYYSTFFDPDDDPVTMAWILDQAVRTPPHVSSSVWEQSLTAWDDAEALARCRTPLLYIDAGTPNADLDRAQTLAPGMLLGRTIGSGHFSPLIAPEQVNAMLDRFLAVGLRPPGASA